MNHPNRVRLSKLSLGLMVALAAAPVFAQSTSSGVGGTVVGTDGQPVAGAEVTITHADSGTVSRATTDASGRYNARGLRVGGPYTITVTKAGEGAKTEENVYLNLNQVNTVNAALASDVATLSNRPRPSRPPCSASIRFSGCGIMPSTLPASLRMPAMSLMEPLGLVPSA